MRLDQSSQTLELANPGWLFGVTRYVLGATGHKVVVWTQGCSMTPKCSGCTSPHTWTPGKGQTVPVRELIEQAHLQAASPSGLVVSGGEPLDQAAGVLALARAFRAEFPTAERVLYTAWELPALQAAHPDLLAEWDVIITGPYQRQHAATALAGSSNQQVHLLTPWAQAAYADWPQWPRHRLQIFPRTGGLVAVGIPDRPALRLVADALNAPAIGDANPSGA